MSTRRIVLTGFGCIDVACRDNGDHRYGRVISVDRAARFRIFGP
ncbi:hypothetical protein OH687_14500 [Burkholderia anthina]|nr:hypothetical protein OH687_14500 [Burkholderia anthina]